MATDQMRVYQDAISHYREMKRRLERELSDSRVKVLDLLDELDAVQILRDHAPTPQLHLVDRLNWTLLLMERIGDQLGRG